MTVIDRRLERIEVYVDNKNRHYYLKSDCGKPIHWYISYYENGQNRIVKLSREKWETELAQAKTKDRTKKEIQKKIQIEKKISTDASMTATSKKIVKTVRTRGYQMTKSEWGYNYLPTI